MLVAESVEDRRHESTFLALALLERQLPFAGVLALTWRCRQEPLQWTCCHQFLHFGRSRLVQSQVAAFGLCTRTLAEKSNVSRLRGRQTDHYPVVEVELCILSLRQVQSRAAPFIGRVVVAIREAGSEADRVRKPYLIVIL
jgi:hypothetical protein